MGDTVYGTPCADVIVVDELGIAEVRSGAGNDIVTVGGDVDFVSAGDGNDIVVATEDVDEVFGGDGNDRIYGDSGPASIEEVDLEPSDEPSAVSYAGPYDCDAASNGADTCYMNSSNTYNGGAGNDIIFGQRGNDKIRGGEGDDRLYGGIGDDEWIRGDEGHDLVSGGPGSERLLGNDGNDIVRGDANSDIMSGGNGIDTLSYATGVTPGFNPGSVPGGVKCGAANPCPGFPTTDEGTGVYVDLTRHLQRLAVSNGLVGTGGGLDTIEDPDPLPGWSSSTVNTFENVIGTPFADYIIGDDGANTIVGGGGADVIVGGSGDDTINGGADGDYLDGGEDTGDNDTVSGGLGNPADNNCVNAETMPLSQCGGSSAKVKGRSTSMIAVGMVGSSIGGTTYHMIYISGSSARDQIWATVNSDFQVVITDSQNGAEFDPDQQGCVRDLPHRVICDPSRLDAIVVAGLGGNDDIHANYNFSGTVSPYVLGGDGDDLLEGADKTEDLLVDGDGADELYGFGHDDDLISGAGADVADAGDDNDVLVTTTICDGGQLKGGDGADDIAWAPVPTPDRAATLGVWADLGQHTAGRVSDNPSALITGSCTTGGRTYLGQAEHLEGTSGRDILVGDGGDNQLLGRAGIDDLYGMGGNDVLQAHARDHDGVLDGGSGTNDKLNWDKVICGDADIDRDNQKNNEDYDSPDAIYGGSKPIEEEVIGGDGPKAFFRLGERTGIRACAGIDQTWAPGTFPRPDDGSYVGMSKADNFGKLGALRASIDTSIRLDGSNDMVVLPNKWDPASYATSGYSVEFWVKLDGDQ